MLLRSHITDEETEARRSHIALKYRSQAGSLHSLSVLNSVYHNQGLV